MNDEFDVIVIGGGSGTSIVDKALRTNQKVALIEMDHLGGTCLNRGCIPTKILIYPADVIRIIENAKKVGVYAKIENIDVKSIFNRMHNIVSHSVMHSEQGARTIKNLKWYQEPSEFVDNYTIKVGSEIITGNKIFIVSGSRPLVPSLKGIEKTTYHTSDTILNIEEVPKSLIIIGGGFVAAEFAHFFSAIGSEVSIIHRKNMILNYLDTDISKIVNSELGKKVKLLTNREAFEISGNDEEKRVITKDIKNGVEEEFTAEEILFATGRKSNADLLKPEKTGVQLNNKGYIKVNEFLETTKDRIWAAGDAIGKFMFKHVANYEVEVAWHNSSHSEKVKTDYHAIPAAVFTYPQIAQVGLTVEECKNKDLKILVGSYEFKDIAMGDAMGEPRGLVKIIVNEDNGRILGAHIAGPEASTLIQEVINVMYCEHGSIFTMLQSLHIHPALPEVVQRAFANLRKV